MGFRLLRMDLLLPPAPSGPVPVVVWIHGGAFLFGSRLHGAVTEPACRALIERGVAVALVEYRFSGEAIGVWGESAGGHLAAFIALNGNDERLVGTVGVTGCSSDVVAGVAWYPDTDFLALGLGSDRTGSPDPTAPEALLIGGPTRGRREDAAFASPVTHVHPGAAPILRVHGLENGLLPHCG